MTRALALLASVALALGALACGRSADAGPSAAGPEQADCERRGAYSVVVVLDEVQGAERVLANGFPLVYTYGPGSWASPGTGHTRALSPALVSGRNVVSVAVAPYVGTTAGGAPAVGPTRFRSWVCAPDGAVVAGTARGVASSDSAAAAWVADLSGRWPAWSRGGGAAVDSARAWAAAHPVRVETAFVRPGGAAPADGEPAFDGVFCEAPVIAGTPADSARLRDYAVRLRDLMAVRDTSALLVEFGPAVRARYETADQPVPWDEFVVANGRALTGGLLVGFEAGDVALSSWSGGRVWGLQRQDGSRLLAWEEGGGLTGPYVAEVDGALRVVR